MAQFHRARRAEHVIPPIAHPLPVETARAMGLKSRIVVQVNGTGALEASTADIPQPWREPKAQQIEQGKDHFRRASGIGRMLHNRQLCLIAQDGIEDIGRIARCDDDGLRAVLRELI